MPLRATIDVFLPTDFQEEIGNPAAYPPSKHPKYISEDDAIAIAFGGAADSLSAGHPPSSAGLMTREQASTLDRPLAGSNAAPHPGRMVWLVCIHDDVQTRGSIAWPPTTVHGYSVVIDAELGMVTDAGWGTAPLGKESCVECQRATKTGSGTDIPPPL
jgi:hypothetical protein